MTNRIIGTGATILALLLSPAVASAELRRVQIGVSGLD